MSVLAYEQQRIRTLRSTWIILAVTLLLAVGGTMLFAVVADVEPPPGEPAFTPDTIAALSNLNSPLVLVPLAILAAMAFGGEYRFALVRQTLTLFPQRSRVFLGKLLVTVVWLVASGVLVWAAILLTGTTMQSRFSQWEPFGLEELGYTGRALVYLVGFCLFVFAVVALSRNQALGLTLVLMWWLVVESLLLGFLGSRIPSLSSVLPMTQGADFVATGSLAALATFLAWLLPLLLAAWVLFVRRDA